MRCVLRQNVFGGLSPTADDAHRREFSYGRHGSPVLHPALESPPGQAIWKRGFAGASGLFSMVLKPAGRARDCR
jgi:cystathionine beta-lyase/cystathionine gamma-synthase